MGRAFVNNFMTKMMTIWSSRKNQIVLNKFNVKHDETVKPSLVVFVTNPFKPLNFFSLVISIVDFKKKSGTRPTSPSIL